MACWTYRTHFFPKNRSVLKIGQTLDKIKENNDESKTFQHWSSFRKKYWKFKRRWKLFIFTINTIGILVKSYMGSLPSGMLVELYVGTLHSVIICWSSCFVCMWLFPCLGQTTLVWIVKRPNCLPNLFVKSWQYGPLVEHFRGASKLIKTHWIVI